MSLHISIDSRIDALVDELAESLEGHRQDPFASEMVVVASGGMRRWLEQQLAERLGIVANTEMVFPAQLIERAKAGDDSGTTWSIDAITAQILAVGSETDTPAALSDLLNAGAAPNRVPRARAVAELFNRYHVHRPEMVKHWADALDLDNSGNPLPAHQCWQPQLWREVQRRLGASPPERLPKVVDGLTDAPAQGLPATIHLFGLSAITFEMGEVLGALANQHRVRMFVASPSTRLEAVGASSGEGRVDGNPLLRTWGHAQGDGVEAITTRFRCGQPEISIQPPASGSEPSTLLAALQQQVRADQPSTRVPGLTAGDDSVTFHGCSGDARQVEVLRDAILTLLRDNPDLTETDITVLCPRLDRFAPLIKAIWGPTAGHSSSVAGPANTASPTGPSGRLKPGPPALRYAVNDTNLRSAAPLLDALDRLLNLTLGRITHSQLRTVLSLEPVQHRFDIEDQHDLGTTTAWLESTAMRWGLNPDQRAGHSNLPTDFRSHTLDSTIEAVLGSMALPDGELTPDGPAAVRVDLSSFDAAGNLAEFGDALGWAISELVDSDPEPMGQWCHRLRGAAVRLLAVAPGDAWQWERLDTVLNELTEAASEAPLTLRDVASLYSGAITGRPGYRTFGSGAIVVDTPKSLRAIPHKVVCLLGFDGDAVARPQVSNDDLIAAQPEPTDVHPAEEAKGALLDALLAASDHLVVTFADHDVHTNAEIQPSTTLQELLDASVTVSGRTEQQLIYSRTRYGFSEANFSGFGPRSFDGRACEASEARRQRVDDGELRWPEPLHVEGSADADQPAGGPRSVSPRDLVRAATQPTDIFVEDRLGVRFPWNVEQPADLLPVELNALEKWHLGNDLLARALRRGGSGTDADLEAWAADKRAAGKLPPGSLGDIQVNAAKESVDEIVSAIEAEMELRGAELSEALALSTESIDLLIDRPGVGGTSIVGAIACRNGRPIRIGYSRLKPKDHIGIWIETLLMAATGNASSAWMIGKNAEVVRCEIATEGTQAQQAIASALRYLVNLHQRAQHEVVPLFPALSKVLAETEPASAPDLTKCDEAWFRVTPDHTDGDRTGNSVAAFFENWTARDILAPKNGAEAAARELYHHIEATSGGGQE